ncbi:MAG TPA: hypothetical protein VFG10_19050 [Saprospiraceae bacterium]|nr:hypothetical protein [Saprospiraceae bacterium]
MADRLLLVPKEVLVIQMALSGLIEDSEQASKDITIPFTSQSRNVLLEIIKTAKSALQKVAAASGKLVQLDPL